MQPPLPRFSRLVRLCRFGVLLLALAAFGAACDRHSATEVPESYGHGSTHDPVSSNTTHQVDSRQGSKHFSDTRGSNLETEVVSGTESAAPPKPGEKAAATPNPMGIGR